MHNCPCNFARVLRTIETAIATPLIIIGTLALIQSPSHNWWLYPLTILLFIYAFVRWTQMIDDWSPHRDSARNG